MKLEEPDNGRKLILVMNYRLHGGLIIERLLEITDKIPQLREMIRRTIRKAQAELDRKFEEKLQKNFQKEELVWYYDKPAAMRHDTKF